VITKPASLLLVILLVLGMIACKKENLHQSSQTQATGRDSLLLSDFPIKTGNSWTYSRVRHWSTIVSDTVTLTVGDSVPVSGGFRYLWIQTSSSGRPDTGYVSVQSNSIRFYADTNMALPCGVYSYYQPLTSVAADLIVFPCAKDSSWEQQPHMYQNSSTCVATDSTITINGASYTHVFLISRTVNDLEGSYIAGGENTYIAKGIGVVRFDQSESAPQFIPITHYDCSLSLLSFSLH